MPLPQEKKKGAKKSQATAQLKIQDVFTEDHRAKTAAKESKPARENSQNRKEGSASASKKMDVKFVRKKSKEGRRASPFIPGDVTTDKEEGQNKNGKPSREEAEVRRRRPPPKADFDDDESSEVIFDNAGRMK